MNARISRAKLYKFSPRLITHLRETGNIPKEVELDTKIVHLVKLRASQINHCGFCQKMHAEEARADGESQSRLDVLPAWREIDLFTHEERIALEWAEALTLVASKAIEDETFNKAVEAFGEIVLIELTSIILQINSWNRIAVGFRFQPDEHS